MSSTENKVKAKYQNALEDKRATSSRNSSLEFYYTKKHLSAYINQDTKVIELGCGTGYYAMYYADKCKEYIGVDITPENISIFNDKIKSKNVENVTANLGDATNLNEYSNSSFDVVLCLGPMYHLPPDERELVFSECNRICKDGGILAFAYINKVGAYAGACVHDKLRVNYPNKKANELILKQNTDDVEPNLFFYTMPEEIEIVAKKYGLTKVKNLATDFYFTTSVVDEMDDEKFELMKPLLDQITIYESCTGMGNHALLICRK